MEICISELCRACLIILSFYYSLAILNLLLLYWCLKTLIVIIKIRISFYDKIEVLKVVFTILQLSDWEAFAVFHEKRKSGCLAYEIQVHLFVLLLSGDLNLC